MTASSVPGTRLGRLVRGAFASTFDKVVILGAQIALVPIFIGHWGVHVYGAWLLLSTVPIYFALSDFGFAVAAGTDMTMATAHGDRRGALATYQSVWVLVLSATLLLAGVALAVIWSVPARLFDFTDIPAVEARATLTGLIGFAVVALQNNVLNSGLRAIGAFALSRAGSGCMFLGEALAMFAAVAHGGGPAAAAFAMMSVRAAGTATLYVMQMRRAPWLHFGNRAASLPEIRRLAPAALASMSLFGADALVLQGTAIAVGFAAGPAGVVVFTTVRTLSRIGTQLAGLLTYPLMPEFSTVAAHDDRPSMARMTLLTVLASLMFVVPMAFGLLVFGRAIVGMWTHGAVVAPLSLVALMAGVIVMNGLWSPLALLLQAINRHVLYSRTYLMGAIVAVGAAYFLSRALGPSGAALAMLGLDTFMVVVVQRLVAATIADRRRVVGALPEVVALLRAQAARFAR